MALKHFISTVVDGERVNALVDMTPEEEAAFLASRPSLAATMRDAVVAKLAEVLAAGYPADFTPYGGGPKLLQTRDLEDRTNWLVSQAAYAAAVAAGAGAVAGAEFRCADNSTVTVTYAEGLAVLLDMAAWGRAMMRRSWELKDAIALAADDAALGSIDITAGWEWPAAE